MTFPELKDFFAEQKKKLIIVADGEPRVSKLIRGNVVSQVPAGGVAIALDPIARATNALYIARGKNIKELETLDNKNKMLIETGEGNYTLKRLFFKEKQITNYYYGFSNQTLWPICHVAFEEPLLQQEWFKGYQQVNKLFAKAVQEEITDDTFVWINDYQLALVPSFLKKTTNTLIGMFWHIPWPTWEVFRILPHRKEILESLLSCDFLAFHRGYQARNFLTTVERELEARIDLETQKVYYNNHATTVKSLPLGVDIDVIKSLIHKNGEEETSLAQAVRKVFRIRGEKQSINDFFKRYRVIFGADRLDYTKGIKHRLHALDHFFKKNPEYIGKVVYLGIVAPSREKITSYRDIKREVRKAVAEINAKYQTRHWKPLHLIYQAFKREDIMNFYDQADLCLVTPLDDGMNLVSKEFVLVSSFSSHPSMLVLSCFAGSAIDLTEALLVNPYDTEEVANAIKQGLEMPESEKKERLDRMVIRLEENNVYQWGYNFIKEALQSAY